MAEFSVGRWTFASKKELKEKLQKLLYESPTGTRLEGEDEELMHALVLLHPHVQDVVGCGVQRYQFSEIV